MRDKIDHIIEEHLQKIYKICLGFTGDHALAKDLTQESCINIYLGFEKFKGRSTVATWVYRVTFNSCLMYKRRQKKQALPLSEINETDIVDQGAFEDDKSKLLLLSRLIAELPEKDRIIMILYLDNLSQKSISDITGISPNYVGVRINRIKNKLSTRFKKTWET